MSYSADEMRILINFHRKYNSLPEKNYYLEYLSILEDEAPYISGDIEADMRKFDDPDYCGEEYAAREHAIGLITTWIAALEAVRDKLKGD